MEKTEFGKRIKILRTERQLTMDMLVTDIDNKYSVKINKGLISRWERQHKQNSLKFGVRITGCFRTS